MLGHRELTASDYAGILKRRWVLILVSAIVFLIVGAGVSFVLPPQYESQTLVLIDQQKVPENYVHPVVEEDLTGRLASMREQILSRSHIEPIVTKFNLFAGGKSTMDDRVDMTRKAIKITQIHSDQAHGMPGFYVSFDSRDARTAQQVCGEITSLFVSEDLSSREASAEGTTDFLKQELGDAKRKLDDQDAKYAEFQRKYVGILPGQETNNANTLQALTSQLDAATQALNRLQQDETFEQALIAQQSQTGPGGEPATVVTQDERWNELRTLMQQKQALEALYTDDHPDVIAISHRIADLQAQINHPAPAAPATAASTATTPDKGAAAQTPPPAPTRPDPPQVQQLKAQLHATQVSLSDARQNQARISQEIRTYQARIEASPAVNEEYKQVTRDHDTALGFYNSLLGKMNESSMATELEHRQQGEQFRVMDAPNLPDAPTFPNPYIFAGGGFALGLFLGMGLAALLEYRDTALRNERDIWAFTKLPTLAIISHIDGITGIAQVGNRWNWLSRLTKPVESAN